MFLPTATRRKNNQGFVISGGGYRYFTNALICIRMLREAGSVLPIELWIWDHEHDPKQQSWIAQFDATIQIAEAPKTQAQSLPSGSRWQWMLKPMAMLRSRFRHVAFLDADSFPMVDLAFLFQDPQYLETGALFWPDVGRMEEDCPIWNMMGVPYRDEPNFESGQMVIDMVRHREPLELALKMNREAEIYYKVIWGDKDTFRFAFHKYGRPFAMTPYPLQMLSLPGMPAGSPGVMCQHDFEGNRIFQHRNMAKWDLLGANPKIPGYLYEEESRGFLKELRAVWNGRLNWKSPRPQDFNVGRWKERSALVKDLISGQWLSEDRRPAAGACCGPPVKWTAQSVSKPWERASGATPAIKEIFWSAVGPSGGELAAVPVAPSLPDQPWPDERGELAAKVALTPSASPSDPVVGWSRGLRRREVAFSSDSTLREGASPEAYWWDLELEAEHWVLYLVNEKGRVAGMTRTEDGGWMGRWLKKPGGVVGLKRVETVFPVLKDDGRGRTAAIDLFRKQKFLHVANHAHGIGDAITGLHAAVAVAVQEGRAVVYHTRFARWLQRASHLLVTITETAPPQRDAGYGRGLCGATTVCAGEGGVVCRAGGVAGLAGVDEAPAEQEAAGESGWSR